MRKPKRPKSQAGFSLLELVISLGVLTVMMGAIFAQINDAQRSSTAEQLKLDLFQEAREFMDQMTRDLRTAGYPSTRNLSSSQTPSPANMNNAVGLVYMSNTDLWFEASLDGGATVSVIHYQLEPTGPGCPCLKRSEVPKVNGDPYTGQPTPSFQTEVQNVQNGTAEDPIFIAYRSHGVRVDHAINLLDDAATIADINTVAVKVTVQSNYPDPRTGQKPTATILSTVKLNNCSNAWSEAAGSVMGCF